jgi:parvulin-like peptidyl-prolyl isomerase
MNKVLQIGDVQIACSQVLAHLQGSPLLPQLLQEIATEELIDRIAAQFQLDLTATPAEFEQLSTQIAGIITFQGMNTTQIAAITTRTIKLQKFKQAGWNRRVGEYFQSVQPQLHRVTYSILLVEDGLLAQELFFRIQSGEQSFAELATEYSQDETASQGGLIGPILTKDVAPEIIQVLSQLTPGGLSPLFQLGHHYGFIRLDRIISPQLDEHLAQLLLDELFDNWLQTQLPQSPSLALAPPQNIANNSLANIQIFAPDFTPVPSAKESQGNQL